MQIFNRALTLSLIIISCGCGSTPDEFDLGGFHYHSKDFKQWKLSKSLREISGLAVTADGRVFAHGDERGIIHQIDYRNGRLAKSFALTQDNDKPLKGDFEGITAVDEHLYLVASNGPLYRFRPGRDGENVAFETIPTGGGKHCEVEGLAYHPNERALLLACKRVHGAPASKNLNILFFSLETSRLDPQRRIIVDAREIAQSLNSNQAFKASGIALSARSGNLLLVSAHQRAVLEVTIKGTLVRVLRWPMERYHRQTEGIVQLIDGTLLVADEDNKKRGRLGVYLATI